MQTVKTELACVESECHIWNQHLRNRIRKNFANIRKLMHFVKKWQHLGIWAQNFRKQISHLKSAFSKYGTVKRLKKMRKLIPFGSKCLNLRVWARNLKNKNLQKILDFPKSEICGCFCLVSARFWLVFVYSARFSSFQGFFFWLIPGFSKYVIFVQN